MAQTTCVSCFLVAVLLTTTMPHAPKRNQQNSSQQNPSIGFAHIESVSPVLDVDAFAEENALQKNVPTDSSIPGRRAVHETLLMNEFLRAFKDSKECGGIAFYGKPDQMPAFTIQIGVRGHDHPARKPSWTWILAYPGDRSASNSEGHGMGGMGSQPNARLTASDICVTVWGITGLNHPTRSVADD
jgi:hypothetical protein